MDSLKKAIIEKCGHNFGFEYTVSESPNGIILGSANHPLQVTIGLENNSFLVGFVGAPSQLYTELSRDFISYADEYMCSSESELAILFRRSSALASSLPNQAERDYKVNLKKVLDELPDSIKDTETERMIRQRVGQQTFRNAMLAYWGHACSVTGVKIPEILRASHAKPWSECKSDGERLDVFNGFLLTANLDALFDRHLISFDKNGKILLSSRIGQNVFSALGLSSELSLRWLSQQHEKYLAIHRANFFEISSP